jgi:hypothetical protein
VGRSRTVAALAASAVVSIALWVGLAWETAAALGLAQIAAAGAVIALVTMQAYPAMALVARPLPLAATGGGLALAALLACVATARTSPEAPRFEGLLYVSRAEAGSTPSAVWATEDAPLDPFARDVFAASHAPSVSAKVPAFGRVLRTSAAPAVALPPPEVKVTRDDRAPIGLRTVELALWSQRAAPVLQVELPRDVTFARVVFDGEDVTKEVHESPRRILRFLGARDEAVTVSLVFDAARAPRVGVSDRSYGLREVSAALPRPHRSDESAVPYGFGLTDGVVVGQTFDLGGDHE